MRIIAVIPCLNEAAFINDIVVKALKHVDRVFVVDDGSSDRTAEVARQAGAEVIRHGKRRGAGAATRSGFQAALKEGANIVVTLDGDGQHDASEIPAVIAPLLKEEADLAIGSRFLKRDTNMPPYRNLGIDVITWLYNVGSQYKISDSQSCFRCYSRRLLETVEITREDFGFSIEVLVKARKQGLKIVEVPASCYYHAESSTLDPITHGLGVAWSVLQLRAAIELCGQKAVL
jgi:glycosyltransferase involved in cell wall biosynthesis